MKSLMKLLKILKSVTWTYSDILEDVKKCISNALPETEPQKTHWEKKADDSNDFVLDLDEDKFKKADVISGDLEVEVSPIKPVLSDNHELVANVVDGRVKRAYKRKKATDVDKAVVLDAGGENQEPEGCNGGVKTLVKKIKAHEGHSMFNLDWCFEVFCVSLAAGLCSALGISFFGGRHVFSFLFAGGGVSERRRRKLQL